MREEILTYDGLAGLDSVETLAGVEDEVGWVPGENLTPFQATNPLYAIGQFVNMMTWVAIGGGVLVVVVVGAYVYSVARGK